eukprot:768672-Hanusia_phi.AAC.26
MNAGESEKRGKREEVESRTFEDEGQQDRRGGEREEEGRTRMRARTGGEEDGGEWGVRASKDRRGLGGGRRREEGRGEGVSKVGRGEGEEGEKKKGGERV